MQTIIRNPKEFEMNAIYEMGFESWADGKSLSEYLDECRESKKYGRGTWYVLEVGGELVSSLINYKLLDGVIGIGSIATVKTKCKNGFAALLIREVISRLEGNGSSYFMLYTEVGPKYYEQFGFLELISEYQKSPAGVAMVRGDIDSFLRKFNFNIPKYF